MSDPSSPAQVGQPLAGFTSWINSLSFSPDGRTLAAGSSDGTIRFWDVDGWQPEGTVLTSPTQVTGTAFVPNHDELASVGEDGTARLWPDPGAPLTGAGDSIYCLAFSADGRRLAVVPTFNPTVQLWDLANSDTPHLLGQVDLPMALGVAAGSGALSPNGNLLAVGTAHGDVQLFDVANPSKAVALGAPLVESTALVEAVAFSPDGRLLAAGGDDNSVALWNVTNPARPVLEGRLLGATNDVLGVDFSADGRLLAVASGDRAVRL